MSKAKRVSIGQIRRDAQRREWRVVGINKRSVEVMRREARDGERAKPLPRSTVLDWTLVE